MDNLLDLYGVDDITRERLMGVLDRIFCHAENLIHVKVTEQFTSLEQHTNEVRAAVLADLDIIRESIRADILDQLQQVFNVPSQRLQGGSDQVGCSSGIGDNSGGANNHGNNRTSRKRPAEDERIVIEDDEPDAEGDVKSDQQRPRRPASKRRHMTSPSLRGSVEQESRPAMPADGHSENAESNENNKNNENMDGHDINKQSAANAQQADVNEQAANGGQIVDDNENAVAARAFGPLAFPAAGELYSAQLAGEDGLCMVTVLPYSIEVGLQQPCASMHHGREDFRSNGNEGEFRPLTPNAVTIRIDSMMAADLCWMLDDNYGVRDAEEHKFPVCIVDRGCQQAWLPSGVLMPFRVHSPLSDSTEGDLSNAVQAFGRIRGLSAANQRIREALRAPAIYTSRIPTPAASSATSIATSVATSVSANNIQNAQLASQFDEIDIDQLAREAAAGHHLETAMGEIKRDAASNIYWNMSQDFLPHGEGVGYGIPDADVPIPSVEVDDTKADDWAPGRVLTSSLADTEDAMGNSGVALEQVQQQQQPLVFQLPVSADDTAASFWARIPAAIATGDDKAASAPASFAPVTNAAAPADQLPLSPSQRAVADAAMILTARMNTNTNTNADVEDGHRPPPPPPATQHAVRDPFVDTPSPDRYPSPSVFDPSPAEQVRPEQFYIQAYWRGTNRRWSGTDSGRFMRLVENMDEGVVEAESVVEASDPCFGSAAAAAGPAPSEAATPPNPRVDKSGKSYHVCINPRDIASMSFETTAGAGDGGHRNSAADTNKRFVTLKPLGGQHRTHRLLFRTTFLANDACSVSGGTQAQRFCDWIQKMNPCVRFATKAPKNGPKQEALTGDNDQQINFPPPPSQAATPSDTTTRNANYRRESLNIGLN